jgi:DNA-binding LacI/PurR family transcriptional regulator
MTSIKDIALRADVSIATVSRALNGNAHVTPHTRERILQLAKELDYHPNAMARSLVQKSSRIFGYIVSGIKKGAKHTIVQDSLMGVYDYARSIGYEILMFVVDSEKQNKKSYLDFVREHSLAGVIMQGLRTDDAYYRDIIDSQIPCVLIDLPADCERVGSVSIDNHAASRTVMQYLIGKGHRHIGYLGGVDEAAVSTLRFQGYLSVLAENGIEPRADYLFHGNFSEEDAYTVLRGFLPGHPELSALFCASDLMAMGAIRAVHEFGIRIPEQLAIVGFDDILLASYVDPPLTTVHQDFSRMGYEAARMLYKIVKGLATPHTKNIPYEFIIRQSG